MARSQTTAGTYTQVPMQDFAARDAIRQSGGTPVGVDDLLKNVNTAWARLRPTVATMRCASGGGKAYLVSTGALAKRYALRFRTLDSARQLEGKTRCQVSDGTTEGNLTLTSVNGGDSDTIALTGADTAWARKTWNPIDLSPDADGREIVLVGTERTAGAGEVRMADLHVRYASYSGALPGGTLASGVEAVDLLQGDADGPLSAGTLRVAQQSIVALHETVPWPVGVYLDDLDTDPSVKAGMATADATRWVMVAEAIHYPQRGMNVEQLEYDVLGFAEDGGSVIIEVFHGRLRVERVEIELVDDAAFDATDTTDSWHWGLLPASLTEPTLVRVHLLNDTALSFTCLRSFLLHAAPRS